MRDERGHIAKKDEEEEEKEEEEEEGRDGAWRSRAEGARDLLSIEENSANFRGTILLKRGEEGGGGGWCTVVAVLFVEISSAAGCRRRGRSGKRPLSPKRRGKRQR